MSQTIRFALIGTGQIVAGDSWSESAQARIGTAIVIALMLLTALALQSRRNLTLDLGVAAFAVTSFVVPIIARRVTANDIDFRVMSPMLIPVIYFVTVMLDRLCTKRASAIAGIALLGWWMYQGVAFAARFPILHPAALVTSRSSRHSCTTTSTPFPPTPESSPTTHNECGGSRIGSRP